MITWFVPLAPGATIICKFPAGLGLDGAGLLWLIEALGVPPSQNKAAAKLIHAARLVHWVIDFEPSGKGKAVGSTRETIFMRTRLVKTRD
jgi:hypothetical protein